MDAILLSRMQFAANITFHILFPSISISLSWFLLFFKLKYSSTGEEKWMDAYKLWVKIFALGFAIGIVSGVTMPFQFGTNWPGFMNTFENVAGPMLAYEVLTAFFLEATFLGIMLYGHNRVSNSVHTFSTLLVALGTTFSAFWILSLNSWMQTPQGFEMIDGKAYVTDWMQVIFNPSFPYRLSHMLLASGLTSSFLIAGISAYGHIGHKVYEGASAALKTGVYAAAILIPIQMFVGDMHGRNTLEYQPEKIAAMEGIWAKSESPVALRLFAIPDDDEEKNFFELKVPHLGSLILTHSFDGEVKGIKSFENHPPVAPLFFSFRVMVGMGVLMLCIAWYCAFKLYRGNTLPKFALYGLVAMTFSGWIATIAGWYTTEIGRQPWIVHGVMKTADAATKIVPEDHVALTLSIYISVYVFLLVSFVSVVFYLARSFQSTEDHAAQS